MVDAVTFCRKLLRLNANKGVLLGIFNRSPITKSSRRFLGDGYLYPGIAFVPGNWLEAL